MLLLLLLLLLLFACIILADVCGYDRSDSSCDYDRSHYGR